MKDGNKSLESLVDSYWTLDTLPEEGKSPYVKGYLKGIFITLAAFDAVDYLNSLRKTKFQESLSSSDQSKEALPDQ